LSGHCQYRLLSLRQLSQPLNFMRRGLRSNCLGACLNLNDIGLITAASCVYDSLARESNGRCALCTMDTIASSANIPPIKGEQTMIFFSKPWITLQTGDSKLTLEMEHRQTFQLPYRIAILSYHPYICSLVPRPLPSFL